jgi:hypothetical protein
MEGPLPELIADLLTTRGYCFRMSRCMKLSRVDLITFISKLLDGNHPEIDSIRWMRSRITDPISQTSAYDFCQIIREEARRLILLRAEKAIPQEGLGLRIVPADFEVVERT